MQMELNVREIAGRLKHNNEMAESHLDEIRSFPGTSGGSRSRKIKAVYSGKIAPGGGRSF